MVCQYSYLETRDKVECGSCLVKHLPPGWGNGVKAKACGCKPARRAKG